jgi:hypothetical protein
LKIFARQKSQVLIGPGLGFSSSWRSLTQKAEAFIILIASQGENSMDSLGRDKSLEQRGGKLNRLAIRAAGHHRTDRAPIIVQIGRGRDVQLKFVMFH